MRPPKLPGYRLTRYLGGGPLFVVWEGRPAEEPIPLAFKFIRADADDRHVARILLAREALAGLLVRHRRLVRVVRQHLDADPPFIALEYVPGENLRDRMKRTGRLDVRSAVWVARQAAEGLAALHAVGFIHADVKPGNVLVDSTGTARLIDLGFAHRPGENVELLKEGFIMGTANYIAPELCRKPQIDTPAADVFSLGVSLFECLTGRLPYPAATSEEALRKRRRAKPIDIAAVPGDWPDRVVELVRAMMAPNPRSRPLAARVVRDLVQIEIDEIRRAGRPSKASA
jgi:serine/threonine protein kinase